MASPSAAIGTRSLRIGGTAYPVLLPKLSDPRLHLATVFVFLHLIGQVEFSFRVSILQILTSLLTCGLLEVGVTFWRKRVLIWPASALLTGNGIAFILRIPGTRHGDWWSTRGLWVYAAVGIVALLSKYLIQFRGRHIFNPSNLALVIFFLVLGSRRSEPLEFWWGPTSIWLILALGIIVCGALAILSRLHLLGVAAWFWLTFAASIGVIAASGHAMSARWHLGPVTNGYFWRILIASPEVFIFLSFMITDPRTVPETRFGRRVYGISIGLLAALLIAPQQTEFASKVALLGSLTLVCAARPLIILLREAAARQSGQSLVDRSARLVRAGLLRLRPAGRAGLGTATLVAAAAFAGLLVLAGTPARSSAGTLDTPALTAGLPQVTVGHPSGVVSIDHRTAVQVAGDVVTDMRAIAPAYRVQSMHLTLEAAQGQGPPTVVARLNGTDPSARTIDLALKDGRFRIIDRAAAAAAPAAATRAAEPAVASKGSSAFASRVELKNVAPQVGLDFRQGAFRYGMSPEPAAMMGGGVCWLDYNNDGWMDLFVVNSYADLNLPSWQEHGGLPQSGLFRNDHGKFVNVTSSSGAGIRVKGTGCVAADFNGDGYTDLFVTTATDDVLLWNNGNGTFTEADRAQTGIVSYGWHAGAAVADVNGDGRPDLFVAGYTDVQHPIETSMAGFPTNYLGIRDELFLNEGNDKHGHAHFREVGQQVGLDRLHEHGLGAVFTDVNGDGRPDLYVANDEDPNRLYLNEPYPGGVQADPLHLGFRFRDVSVAEGVADKNAGMGVAPGDYNGDGHTDLFITNSRNQQHAAFASKVAANGTTSFVNTRSIFAAALGHRTTVGWGDSWVDLDNDGFPDLVIANGAIPVTNLKADTEPVQVLQNLSGEDRTGQFENASGVVDPVGMPKIIGRGLAAADVDNNGKLAIAINSIGGPLVLLENTGPAGHWLEVSMGGFYPDALLTATLPDGRKLVQEIHAGSSYLSSEDPRAHFGLGAATRVAELTIRYPDGRVVRLHDIAGNQILKLAPEPRSAR